MIGAAVDIPPPDLPVLESPLAAGSVDYYAIRRDGSLWIGAAGYGTAANDPESCFKIMEQAAYICQGELTMLALDGNGRI